MKRHGFTLTEMLVIMAIVLILIALLLPGIEAARNAMGLAVCTDNLRKIYFGFMTFVEDHGAFPAVQGVVVPPDSHNSFQGWPRLIAPYLNNEKNIFQCPGDPIKRWPFYSSRSRYTSYGYPFRTFAITVSTPDGGRNIGMRPLAHIPSPSDTILLAEEPMLYSSDRFGIFGGGYGGRLIGWGAHPYYLLGGYHPHVPIPSEWLESSTSYASDNRHLDPDNHDKAQRTNLLFIDGHVRAVPTWSLRLEAFHDLIPWSRSTAIDHRNQVMRFIRPTHHAQ